MLRVQNRSSSSQQLGSTNAHVRLPQAGVETNCHADNCSIVCLHEMLLLTYKPLWGLDFTWVSFSSAVSICILLKVPGCSYWPCWNLIPFFFLNLLKILASVVTFNIEFHNLIMYHVKVFTSVHKHIPIQFNHEFLCIMKKDKYE